jgi:hypothetical protein
VFGLYTFTASYPGDANYGAPSNVTCQVQVGPVQIDMNAPGPPSEIVPARSNSSPVVALNDRGPSAAPMGLAAGQTKAALGSSRKVTPNRSASFTQGKRKSQWRSIHENHGA